MFSATPSGAWLPAVVAGDTGVLMGQRLQSALTDASSPNVVAPGKRPRITLTPTLVLKDGIAHIQVGAGIVADSDPPTEYQETLNKANAVLSAVAEAERMEGRAASPVKLEVVA